MAKTRQIAAVALTAALYLSAQGDTIPDYNLLNEVVVTGTRAPRLLKDSPVQTILITSSDIRKSDATDIEDLLQTQLPGIEFSYAMNQQVHLNMGGFGGQGVLFLVNGERLAGETMDDVDFSRLDMSNVERIEIVKGASSALYGSNAGGGVVNIITRKGKRPWRLDLNARVGKHSEQRYTLTLLNRHKILSNTLNASYHDIANYDVRNAPDPATQVFSTVYGNRNVNVQEELSLTPAQRLRLTGRAGFFYRQLTRTVDTPERYRDYSAGLSGDWDIRSGSILRVSYAFDQYDKSDYHRRSGLDVRSYSNVQNSLRALWTYETAREDVLTIGADYLHDYLMNVKMSGEKRIRDNADIFAQYDWRISPEWELVGVARYDWFSDGRLSRVTPKLSACYRPATGLNLRLAYGMGFRAPSLKEKYYDFDMAGIWIVLGNPSLKPETSHNINLSADYTHGGYNISVTGFYNKVRDKITTGLPYCRPGEENQLYLDYINIADYGIAGVDMTLQGTWSNGLSARIAYSFNKEWSQRDKEGNRANNQYMPTRPHSLTARVDWTHEFHEDFRFSVGMNGRFLSEVTNNEYKDYYDIAAGTTRVRYPAYTLWDLSCFQTFPGKVRLTVGLDNIFNYKPRYYYMNAPLTDGIALRIGVGVELQ